jgi:hypothetical protein
VKVQLHAFFPSTLPRSQFLPSRFIPVCRNGPVPVVYETEWVTRTDFVTVAKRNKKSWEELKSELHVYYYRRSVLVSGIDLGPSNNFPSFLKLFSDSYGFVDVGLPL